MVAGLTIGKKKYAEVEAQMQAIRVMAENLRKELTQAVEDDSASLRSGDGRLPTSEGDGRRTDQAQRRHPCCDGQRSARPLRVAKDAVKVMELASKCAKEGNLNAISDAASGFAMARAALDGLRL